MVNKVGGPGNDDLVGTTGNDNIDGKGGADDMTGLTGNDVYIVDDVNDAVFENLNEGTDTVKSSVSIAALFANVENLSLTGTLGIDATGNNLFNIITGNAGNNTLDGGGFGEADSLIGGKGNDTYIVDNVNDLLKEATSATGGIDTVVSSVDWTLSAGFENLTAAGKGTLNLTGNTAANTITGNDDGNFLNGGGGNDILIGGKGNDVFDNAAGTAAGADNMTGGDGDDTYIVDNAGDVVNENALEGTDTVVSSITYTLGANVENLALSGKANINGTGNAGNNVITGNSGNNILTGAAGNDTLDQFTNGGNDTLFGGTDDDYYLISVYNGNANVSENVNEGNDTVETDGSYALTANVENLILGANANDAYHYLSGNALNNVISNNSNEGADLYGNDGDDTLTGSATVGNSLFGNNNDDTLIGGASNDYLDGGAGEDDMSGGAGDDTYIVDDANDDITENSGEGTDTIYTTVTRAMDDNVENMFLLGNAAINGIGNAEDNQIIGNDNVNLLLGNDGNDYLDGGAGADIMDGGKGDDRFIVDNVGDTVTEAAGEGNDTVASSVSYTLGSEVENLDLVGGAGPINGTGNSGDNTLNGNQSDNTLDGGGSTNGDYMAGSGGNDVFIVRNLLDIVQESLNDGTDTVQTHVDFGTTALFGNVENLLLADPAVIYGTGNSLSNTITGNGQDNTLDGQGGNDILIGGGGNDFYIVRSSGDFLIDNAGASDQLLAFTSFNMSLNATNVENGTLDDAAGNANLTGNSLVNKLAGNTFSNTIDGGIGADVMVGNGGNDTFIVDNALEDVTGGAGNDTIRSSISWDLADSTDVDNITLTGTGNNNATGDANANTLIGNDGDNALDGQGGADYMAGGKGNDTMTVDDAGDVTAENANEGNDTVNASVSHTIGANIENLTLTAAGLTGTGNGSNNIISGFFSGTNILYGMGGDDFLVGGGDTDSLDGGTGMDYLIGGAGTNFFWVDNAGDYVDNGGGAAGAEINSTISWDLSNPGTTTNVFNLNLIGSGTNLVGTGTGGVNVLNNNTSGANTVTLNGGGGADTMVNNNATLGATTVFIVDNLGDAVTGAALATDNIQSSVNYTLGANQDNLTLTGAAVSGTGNGVTNTIVGTSGNNTLDGGAGSDRLFGGLGDDYYVIDQVGEVVTENTGEGTDTVEFNAASGGTFVLWDNVENGILAAGPDVSYTLIGNSLNNTLTNLNTSSTVVLNGGLGADTMIGANINETFFVDNAGDSVTGGGGAGDLINSSINWNLNTNSGGVLNLTLLAGFAAALNATGTAGVNTLTGNEFNNSLDGQGGADVMAGGLGNDTYFVDDAGDVTNENAGEGTDTVQSSVTWTLAANTDVLILTGVNIDGTGNTGNNTVIGSSGNNTIDGGAGVGFDVLTGGLGNDYYISHASGGDVITENVGEGTDTIDFRWNSFTTHVLAANIENGILGAGVTGNLTGNSLANTLTGNDLGQTLDGQGGTDVMIGLDGNDSYVVDDVGDQAVEAAGKGTDTVYSSVTFTLGANVEDLILTGAANINGTGNADANSLTGNSGNNTLNGAAGADVMAGGDGNDLYIVDDAGDVVNETGTGTDTVRYDIAGSFTLGANVENGTANAGVLAINITGNGLNNTLTGNAGDNSLDGGAGVDNLIGNGGNDTFFVDNTADVATGGAGTDTVVTTALSFTIGATIENIIAGAGISDNATLTGNAGNNTLDGSAGFALTLDGGLGADTFIGNASNEVFVFNEAGDNVQTGGNAGDTIASSITWDLNNANSGGATNLTLTGAGNINGTGTADVNTLIGNDGNNSLDGGAGADYMAGGKGNDTYFIDDAGDVVVENAGAGNDTVNSTFDFTLGNDVENLILLGTAVVGIGSNVSNNITGNDQDNTLDGMAGADAMTGGKGNDLFFVDNVNDQVFENAGEGTDTVNSSVSFTLSANVDNLVLSGVNTNGTGNADANTIIGTSGANTLDGGGGADRLIGGDGNDTYVTDQPGDVLEENPGEGAADTVIAGYSYALQAEFENLQLSGTGDFTATGNGVDNVIQGNSGNNDIDGGAGADYMLGGAGNDDYVVDNVGDNVEENFGEGTDTVLSNIDEFTLGANIENLIAGALLVDVLFGGNASNNTIDASAISGSASLDGGAGADTLIGAANDDTFVVDNAGDNVTSNGGNDQILSSITWDLNVNSGGIVNLTLTGKANINATGTGGNDVITGNTGNNTLTGNGGDDILDGGLGADSMVGGLGDDVYFVDNAGDRAIEAAGAGTGNDTVNASVNHTLGANIENGTATGTMTLTGNAGNNTLTATGIAGGTITLAGGGGTDTFINGQLGGVMVAIVDDLTDTVQGSALSTDNVQSSVSFTLDGDSDNLTLTGTGAINGVGNALVNNITGNSGANSLDGGGGADVLTGGKGNDTYFVYGQGETVVELANGGTDTVQTNNSFDLSVSGANVENLLAFGGSDITLIGNNLNNTITGDAGGDFLSGLGGADILIGGSSNDILDGGIGKDKLTGNGGADRFLFTAAPVTANADTVTDFSTGQGDILDISNLLTGYVDGVSNVTDFVQIVNSGANATLKIDVDGAANGVKFVTVATITGGAAMNLTDEAALEAAGNLFLG